MTGPPRSLKRAALLAVLLCVAACGSPGTATDRRTAAPTGEPPAMPHQQTSPEDRMMIEITIGDQRFPATLDDSPAARDLVAQLPVTLEMDDHGSVEKTGPLPAPLSLDGQPAGADPDVGDVGYYAPGNDLVLYYGDQSYYTGIVILGHLEGDAARRLAEMAGSVTATVEIRHG
jgi:hypothetical protein